MRISNDAIKEFQQLYKKEFGQEITIVEARKQGERLLQLFKIIYRPIRMRS